MFDRYFYVIPLFLIVVIWTTTGGFWFHHERHPGGVVHTPDQAIAIALHECPHSAEIPDAYASWKVWVEGDSWYAGFAELRYGWWGHAEGGMSAKINATTGRPVECRLGIT